MLFFYLFIFVSFLAFLLCPASVSPMGLRGLTGHRSAEKKSAELELTLSERLGEIEGKGVRLKEAEENERKAEAERERMSKVSCSIDGDGQRCFNGSNNSNGSNASNTNRLES